MSRPNENESMKKIKMLLEQIQKGYTSRDESTIDSWVDQLFHKEVTIIGTNAVRPGDFEWKKGLESAKQMFENDWKNWGDVKMDLDEAEVDIVDNVAWVALYATVTRNTAESDTRSSEASRKRSLQRIKEYTEKEWTSTRVLYEVIYDASMILTQYERGDVFVWPIRITLGLIDEGEGWKIRQVHFSFPGRGFPNVRIEN